MLDALLRVLDAGVIVAAALIAYLMEFRHAALPDLYILIVALTALLSALVFSGFGLYRPWRGSRLRLELRLLSVAWLMVFAVLLALIGLLESTAEVSRAWLLAWFVIGAVSLYALRTVLRLGLRWARSHGFNHRRIVVVGSQPFAMDVARQLRSSPWAGLDIVHVFTVEDLDGGRAAGALGDSSQSGVLRRLIESEQIDQVWIAMALREEDRVKELLHGLRHSTADIRWVPDIFGFRLLNHSITEVAELPVLNLSSTPMYGVNRALKAIEDHLLSLLILTLVSPLLLIVAIGVKLSSPGPIIYKQLRHGWNGKPIRVYKFRTMYAEHLRDATLQQAQPEDARVTPFGRFLRRTSLDELPQFYNVLQGRMSIVGPRPHALEHNEEYKDLVEQYMLRHKVKPGITGWAQINGYRGRTDALSKMEKRVQYDLFYIENWSLWFDMKIIVLSFFRGFMHRNAY